MSRPATRRSCTNGCSPPCPTAGARWRSLRARASPSVCARGTPPTHPRSTTPGKKPGTDPEESEERGERPESVHRREDADDVIVVHHHRRAELAVQHLGRHFL